MNTPGVAANELVDPATLMRIRSLPLRARVVVEGFRNGLHRSPYHGFSVEFTEYREYTPGDDPRYLDWKLHARTDRYHIKRFEDETNLRCHLIVDASRSMGFGTIGYSKSQYAATLAATLAHFLDQQRDAVGLLTFDAELRDVLPARQRPGHFRRLLAMLERPPSGKATDLGTPLRQVGELVRKRGLIVLLSDLLAPTETFEHHLGVLRACGHEVLVYRILDPAEPTLGVDEPGLVEDIESGQSLFVDPRAARAGYQRRFGDHAEELAAICRKLGVDYQSQTTDQPLEFSLLEYLRGRMRRGKTAGKARGRGR